LSKQKIRLAPLTGIKLKIEMIISSKRADQVRDSDERFLTNAQNTLAELRLSKSRIVDKLSSKQPHQFREIISKLFFFENRKRMRIRTVEF
jgi:hypothetical protein